jgi:hypothetical protein
MVPSRVSEYTEFAPRHRRIFGLNMHLVRADLRQSAGVCPADLRASCRGHDIYRERVCALYAELSPLNCRLAASRARHRFGQPFLNFIS